MNGEQANRLIPWQKKIALLIERARSIRQAVALRTGAALINPRCRTYPLRTE